MHNSESPTSSIRRRAASVVVALALVLAACDGRQRAIDGLRGVKLSPVRPKPEFTLDDTHGQPFHFAADTRGMATLLYFGYQLPRRLPDAHVEHRGGAQENARRRASPR